jgi:hypothetical protein
MAGLYFLQLETKSWSNAEIDGLYANNVPPRLFSDFAIVDGQTSEKETKKPSISGRFDDKTDHIGRGVS